MTAWVQILALQLLAVQPGVSYSTSLALCFLISKMEEVIMGGNHETIVGIK